MKGKISWFHFWLAASSLTIIHLAIFDWLILTAPESIQVQYIPDDAFYYLVLARNFTSLKLWSFDGGFSVTSGFHPLLAYLLMLLHSFFQPKSEEFIQIGIALSSSITLITLSIVWWVGLISWTGRRIWETGLQQPAASCVNN